MLIQARVGSGAGAVTPWRSVSSPRPSNRLCGIPHNRFCGSRRVRLPPATRPAQGPAVRAARAGHRQAGQLPGRPPRAHVVGGAPAVAVSEPRRELSSAHPATRTGDETLQNRRGMRNGSCPPSAASPHTSGRDGICSARPNGEPRWPTASRSGVRSPRPTLPPEM